MSHKKYAQLTGIVNTRYPNLLRGDERIIYDSNYAYKIVADGYGGFTIKKRIKLK